MLRGDKELIVVGDRVLIRVEEVEERTEVGLYLPPTAVEKESVQSGRVEEVGPGIPLPPKAEDEDVPWSEEKGERPRYIPLQAHRGDTAVFLKRDAVEIKFDNQKYMVVPHSAILVIVRPVVPLGEVESG
jgi:co-chaperonin GroES (HSP10)